MKKLLVVSALALGLSSIALAGGIAEKMPVAPVATAPVAKTGFNQNIYVGIQGGWANSGLKMYDGIGGTLSLDRFDFDVPYTLSGRTSVSNDTGWGGRIFVGYQFHKYFAVEAGYFLMRTATVSGNGLITTPDNATAALIGTGYFNDDVKTQAFDIVAKGIIPVNDSFNFYAKLGAGYLMNKESINYGYDFSSVQGPKQDFSASDNNNNFAFVYGLGAAYHIENWTLDLSWTRWNSTQSKIMNNNWQPNVDLYALGVSYKFDL
jgi:opacity protein-like surface antigen